MKKRTMVMALTAVAVAGALTACGGGTKDNSGAAADTKAAESKEAQFVPSFRFYLYLCHT